MNETCGKGKGKGNGGKGEHGGIGEDGGKGIQQQSMKMMKGEEEQVTDEEDERVQVAPNMGAGGSHPPGHAGSGGRSSRGKGRNTITEMGGL